MRSNPSSNWHDDDGSTILEKKSGAEHPARGLEPLSGLLVAFYSLFSTPVHYQACFAVANKFTSSSKFAVAS